MSMSTNAASKSSKTIVDRPMPKGKTEVSLSSFCFLFSEMVQYCQNRINTTQELEKKLAEIGHSVGIRMLELSSLREKTGFKREIKIVGILSYIKDTIWKVMFGKAADSLERVTDKEDEYMIHEKDPLVNTYISVPKEYGHLNCAAFVAGVG
mmetsp:Transcript_9182/g.21050  ORF Transcript_9182/g.21050 Transcript_9182/m.21050 type:complete len:152 (-) Transcript_9182:14-469(-)